MVRLVEWSLLFLSAKFYIIGGINLNGKIGEPYVKPNSNTFLSLKLYNI
jgi:hypothetical protein